MTNTMKVAKIITIIAALTMSISAFAQAQITTKKEKVSDFTIKTMKVALSGNEFIDQAIRESMNNTWSLSPFEFCTIDEFEKLKNNEEYYFMVPVKALYRKETAPGVMMLCLVKGKPEAKNINDMVDVISMPICAADIPSGREAAMLPGILDIMQGYVSKSMQTGFKGIGSYTKPLSKSRKVVVCEDDLCEAITEKDKAKYAKKGVMITDEETADSLFMIGNAKTVVSYVVAPADPQKGSFCWNFLIDAKTHDLYYFRKHKITKPELSGFLKSDMGKISK